MGMSVPGYSCRSSTSLANTTGCLIKLSGECVSYTGASLSGPGINTGDLLNTVINKLADYTALGGGTVTSVGLTMPAAFSVTNSPVTTSGTFAITAIGTTVQYIRGDGSLATFPTIPTVPTFSNGLTLASGIVKLGGALIEATTITGSATTDTITLSTPATGGVSFTAINTATTGGGAAILATNASASGFAISAVGGIGKGLIASGITAVTASSSGIASSIAVFASASGNTCIAVNAVASGSTAIGYNCAIAGIGTRVFQFSKSETTVNVTYTIGSFEATTVSNPPTSGFGVGIDFRLTSTVGQPTELSNHISSSWTIPTFASRTSVLTITGLGNAVTNTLLTLTGTGRAAFPMYGDGLFTAGTAAYGLGVDSSGNIMEMALGGGGTVNSFVFTDGNGFDGTVTSPGTTPTLSLTTTVANTQVLYSTSGALTGHAGFTHSFAGGFNTLTLGAGGASQGGVLSMSYGSGGGGALISKFSGTDMIQFGFNNSAQFAGSANTASGRTFYVADQISAVYRLGMGGDGTLYIGPSTASYGLAVQQPTSGTSMTILANGNVGLGINAPTADLQISKNVNGGVSMNIANVNSGASAEAALALVTDIGYAAFENFGSGFGGGLAGSAIFTTQSTLTGGLGFATLGGNPIKFLTNGTSSERMRITGTGNVGIGTTAPNAAALLQLDSTTQGFLPPRMDTTQRDAITAVAGLMIYNTSTNKLNFYNGAAWEVITSA